MLRPGTGRTPPPREDRGCDGKSRGSSKGTPLIAEPVRPPPPLNDPTPPPRVVLIALVLLLLLLVLAWGTLELACLEWRVIWWLICSSTPVAMAESYMTCAARARSSSVTAYRSTCVAVGKARITSSRYLVIAVYNHGVQS